MQIKTTLRRSLTVGMLLFAAFSPSAGAVSQPPQPTSGPGGGADAHRDYRVTYGGKGSDAWYVFEPQNPTPKSAPVTVITHGYFELYGYESQRGLIEHTVRNGSIVVYPRWQTGVTEPCPGPFDIEPCVRSMVNGINGALRSLQVDDRRVQPDLSRTSYFGFSFGGILTANVLNRWKALGVPKPGVMFLDDPHDGGYTGPREPALDDTLAGIPSTTLVQCHSGATGVFDDPYTGAGELAETGKPRRDASCNAVFPRLTSVPTAHKTLVLTEGDDHGTPALTADHGVCAGPISTPVFSATLDAYDTGFCWKTWDALRQCRFEGTFCRYALGDTPQHRYIGTWDDGTPITGLKIQNEAPIRAEPAPAREAAPPPNVLPTARRLRLRPRRLTLRTTDDDGVLRVSVAVGRVGSKLSRFRAAHGARSWSARTPRRLRPGSYRVAVRLTDTDAVTRTVVYRKRLGG